MCSVFLRVFVMPGRQAWKIPAAVWRGGDGDPPTPILALRAQHSAASPASDREGEGEREAVPPLEELKVERGPRPDVPVRRPYARGNQREALAIASSALGRTKAVRVLRAAMWSKTTLPGKESRWRLSRRILRSINGGDALPLTVGSLETLAGALRGAKYRSAPQYLSEAKDRQIEAGADWTQQLARALRLCRAACLRGQGPPRKSAEARMASVLAASEETARAVNGGLLDPKAAWFVACWWLLREVELAGLRLCHVSFQGEEATLMLPISKTDTGGSGKCRTMCCICDIKELADGRISGGMVCPVCILWAQVKRAECRLGISRGERATTDASLFPNTEGDTPGAAKLRSLSFVNAPATHPRFLFHPHAAER